MWLVPPKDMPFTACTIRHSGLYLLPPAVRTPNPRMILKNRHFLPSGKVFSLSNPIALPLPYCYSRWMVNPHYHGYPENLSLYIYIYFLNFLLGSMPNAGLELKTLRSRVPCSTTEPPRHPRKPEIFKRWLRYMRNWEECPSAHEREVWREWDWGSSLVPIPYVPLAEQADL